MRGCFIGSVLFLLIILSCQSHSNSGSPPLQQDLPAWSTPNDHLTIDGLKVGSLSICEVTLSDLDNLAQGPNKYRIDELDLGNSGFIQDSRYENGKGYASLDIPGLIFQKESGSEAMSKIRLVAPFKGKIEGIGNFEIGKLKVSEVTNGLTGFDWTIRGNSDYWKYTNDTLSFYVPIDHSIPQFPLDENHYADHVIAAIEVTRSCYEIYGPVWTKNDTIYQKPLYAPLADKHRNKYILTKKDDLGTITKELATSGKKTNFKMTRFGRWVEYDAEHHILVEEYYDNTGKLIEKKK